MRISIFALLTLGLTAASLEARPRYIELLPKCRLADATTEGLIEELKAWMTTTDVARKAHRDTLFKIPVVSVSQISVVTSENTCGKVIQAYTAMTNGYTPTNLYVIQLGSKGYAAHDPDDKAGDMSIVQIFDSKYKRIGGWTGA